MEKVNDWSRQIIYGTGNPAKLDGMKRWLEPLGIHLIGLMEFAEKANVEIPSIAEDGISPLENARKKALGYYHAFHMPVFSCDSGLYLDGVPEEKQPGVHVRRIDGKYLTDEEMLEYYTELIRKYGENGRLKARYKNAICLVLNDKEIYEAMEPGMESEAFLLTSERRYAVRQKGFPLDSISIDIKTGKYYYDLDESELDQVAGEKGFLEFFEKILISVW